mmetsp:Transcript_17974/g.68140  ORF Transcript_17974/g.68140 Transcript_17974/m.68140 type:complete len:204 (-) Transcript_17974:449-1060(-)
MDSTRRATYAKEASPTSTTSKLSKYLGSFVLNCSSTSRKPMQIRVFGGTPSTSFFRASGESARATTFGRDRIDCATDPPSRAAAVDALHAVSVSGGLKPTTIPFEAIWKKLPATAMFGGSIPLGPATPPVCRKTSVATGAHPAVKIVSGTPRQVRVLMRSVAPRRSASFSLFCDTACTMLLGYRPPSWAMIFSTMSNEFTSFA